MKELTQKNSSTRKKDEQKGKHTLFIGSKKALLGGVLAAAIALAGQWLIGQVYSGYEARRLLEAMTTSAHYLGGAVVTASATIIALMLTMLSLTNQAKKDFETVFYKRIERIGVLATISLIGGILLLLFLSVPLQEADTVPSRWFTSIYYVLISFLAILSGLLVAIVLMLLNAMTSLIDVVRPEVNEDDNAAE